MKNLTIGEGATSFVPGGEESLQLLQLVCLFDVDDVTCHMSCGARVGTPKKTTQSRQGLVKFVRAET